MRIEDLTVALRPRTAWEAVELGSALVRRHAAAVWTPWLLLSLPVLLLVNLLCWALGAVWLAPVLMWWLKPAFDRIPLYVLSRAVFGHAPGARQTLRAQWHWGRRCLPAYLIWRRLGPVRSLYLPVDLLEGGTGEDARARRRALGAPVYGVGVMLTVVFFHFELALVLGSLVAAMLFVPNEFVQDVVARLWNVLETQPLWLQLCINAAAWLATTALEPFYVGAGFGLYLNRRTEIEAWDIEIVLRRLRARLAGVAAPLLLAAVAWCGGLPFAHADDQPRSPPTRAPACAAVGIAGDEAATTRTVFGADAVEDPGWRQAVKRAYEDPTVSPRHAVNRWVPKNPRDPAEPRNLELGFLGELIALVGEYGLWIVVGALALALLLTAPKWLGWLRDAAAREGREPAEVRRAAVPDEAPLPDDVPTTARRLWRAGRERDALALVYRASVAAMAERAQVALVPGATEAHTLRASRQMPLAADRDAFARTVRTWQLAAYAHGLPAEAEFEDLLATLAQRFAWSATEAAA